MKLSTWTPAKQIRYIDAGGWIFGPSFAAMKDAFPETMTTAGAAPFEPPPLLSGMATRLTLTDVVVASRNARLLLDEAGVPYFADNHAIQLLKLPKETALFKSGSFAYLEGGIAAIRITPGDIPAVITQVASPAPVQAAPKPAKKEARAPAPKARKPEPGPDLRTIFRQAKSLIGSNSTRAARAILFEDERITFTDLDHTISLHIPGLRAETPFAVDVLDLEKLNLPKAFAFELEGDTVHIREGAFAAKLSTIPLDDLPRHPTPPTTLPAVDLDIPRLLTAAKRVLHAADTQGSPRIQLQAVGIDTHLAASDGHRLAVVPFATETEQPMWTLPIPILPFLQWPRGAARLVPPKEMHEWLLWEDGSWMRIEYHRFPEWRKVISASGEQIQIRFSRQPAIAALEALGKSKECSLLLSANSITVAADNVRSEFEASVSHRPSDLSSDDTEPIDVRMNPKYLIQALKAAETETIDVEMDWAGKQPSQIRFSSGDLFQVLMPLRR